MDSSLALSGTMHMRLTQHSFLSESGPTARHQLPFLCPLPYYCCALTCCCSRYWQARLCVLVLPTLAAAMARLRRAAVTFESQQLPHVTAC